MAFASILRDLTHELGFQCVVTHSAAQGAAATAIYRPKAILLDVNLPDHSGLGVLDQLKRNPQTRHIPVHIVSVADYTHEALAMGAVGYALKPVKREQLVEALKRLEQKFSQDLRHVLIVEDDERQRESLSQLLGNGNVLHHRRRPTPRRPWLSCKVDDLRLHGAGPESAGSERL